MDVRSAIPGDYPVFPIAQYADKVWEVLLSASGINTFVLANQIKNVGGDYTKWEKRPLDRTWMKRMVLYFKNYNLLPPTDRPLYK